MKIQSFRRFTMQDYTGAPTWFQNFLNALDPMIDTLNFLLQNNIDLDNNILGERQTISLKHNVPITVKMKTLGQTRPNIVTVGYAQGFIGSAAITAYNADGTVDVTVFFQGAILPTGSVSTMLFFQP